MASSYEARTSAVDFNRAEPIVHDAIVWRHAMDGNAMCCVLHISMHQNPRAILETEADLRMQGRADLLLTSSQHP